MAGTPVAEDLERLEVLDRRFLHVFVAGPGRGEGIAVVLPHRGWLVVDGCRAVDGSFPLEHILTQWLAKDDRIEALLLTHPHDDHVAGIPRVIEGYNPAVIALVASDPPTASLVLEVIARYKRARTTAERLDADAVYAAISAIQTWADKPGHTLLPVTDGTVIEVGAQAAVRICAPTRSGLTRFLREEGRERRMLARANEMSAVAEIAFGQTRLVLGGDLPRYRPGRRTGKPTNVLTGWDTVLRTHERLGAHHGLKVPHHGSRDAHHPGLMTSRTGGGPRIWWVTPHNSSRLPRLAEGEGLDELLAQEPEILLTALPAALRAQARHPPPGRVSREQLVRRLDLQPTGDPFLDAAIEITPGSAVAPLDSVWCAAFDDRGGLAGRWRGLAAFEVVR
jgi:hypothetical protein